MLNAAWTIVHSFIHSSADRWRNWRARNAPPSGRTGDPPSLWYFPHFLNFLFYLWLVWINTHTHTHTLHTLHTLHTHCCRRTIGNISGMSQRNPLKKLAICLSFDDGIYVDNVIIICKLGILILFRIYFNWIIIKKMRPFDSIPKWFELSLLHHYMQIRYFNSIQKRFQSIELNYYQDFFDFYWKWIRIDWIELSLMNLMFHWIGQGHVWSCNEFTTKMRIAFYLSMPSAIGRGGSTRKNLKELKVYFIYIFHIFHVYKSSARAAHASKWWSDREGKLTARTSHFNCVVIFHFCAVIYGIFRHILIVLIDWKLSGFFAIFRDF